MGSRRAIGAVAGALAVTGLTLAAVPYWTNGVPLATPPLTGAERLPADTYLAGSTAPQQEGISISQVQGYVISTPGTWTALQKFGSGELAVLGSSAGYDYFTSGYAGASTFALALPAYAGGVVVTNTGSPVQGDLLFYSGSVWTDLAAGSAQSCLLSQGASANPVWGACALNVGHSPVLNGSTATALFDVGGVLTEIGSNGSGAVELGSGGTWTPTDASGAGLSFGSVVGNYFIVGNLVVATAQFTSTGTADGSNAVIGGLPVTALNSGAGAPACRTIFNATATYSQGFILAGTKNISIVNTTGNPLLNSAVYGASVYLSCVYLK